MSDKQRMEVIVLVGVLVYAVCLAANFLCVPRILQEIIRYPSISFIPFLSLCSLYFLFLLSCPSLTWLQRSTPRMGRHCSDLQGIHPQILQWRSQCIGISLCFANLGKSLRLVRKKEDHVGWCRLWKYVQSFICVYIYFCAVIYLLFLIIANASAQLWLVYFACIFHLSLAVHGGAIAYSADVSKDEDEKTRNFSMQLFSILVFLITLYRPRYGSLHGRFDPWKPYVWRFGKCKCRMVFN